MKKILLFLPIALLMSCGASDTDHLNINIKLQYDSQPLVFFENVQYPDGRDFEFTRISLYVSELSLMKDSESTMIEDVAYWDLTPAHSSLTNAEQGFNYMIEFDEKQSYDSFSLNFGLTDEQNNSTPEDYPSSSPLSLSGEYWSNWGSYVYLKVEGRIDLDGDGISDGVAFHTGSSDALRNMVFNNLDSEEEINLLIDMKDFFDNNGTVYDINANPRLHSLNQIGFMEQLMGNFVAATQISTE